MHSGPAKKGVFSGRFTKGHPLKDRRMNLKLRPHTISYCKLKMDTGGFLGPLLFRTEAGALSKFEGPEALLRVI